MSDESQPPQLRLRPRKRDDEPTAVPTPTPPPSEVTPPAGAAPVDPAHATSPAADTSPRFRLKPKLAHESEVAAIPETPLVTPPAPSVPVVHAPPPVVPYEPTPGEIPRLKLKPLTSISAPPPVKESPEATTPVVPVPVVPMSPSVPDAAAPVSPVVPPMPGLNPVPPVLAGGGPPLIVPSTVPIPPPVAPPPPVVLHMPVKPAVPASRAKKSPVAAMLGVLVVASGVAAYFVFLRPISHAPKAVPASPATVSVKPAAAPLPPAPEPVAIAPLPPPPSLLSPVTLSTDVNPVPSVPVVSPQFRAWVENARVTGVITGSSPKAIINGRLARPGDMIDAAEGIALDSIDAEHKQLVFRNRSGATFSKPY